MNNLNNTIWNLVWLGFYTEEEILEVLMEEVWGDYFENQISQADIELFKNENQATIQRYLALKQTTETAWSHETDIERLEKAFEELRTDSNNLIALHIAGDDYEDAIENIGDVFFEEYDDLTEVDLTKGYCFYHEKDALQLIPDFEQTASKVGSLPIYFGNIEGMEEEGMEEGKKVLSVLKKYGFEAQWDGELKSPIVVQNFRWESRTEDWD